MIEFDTAIRIGRAPGQVFAVLADFETYLARWAMGPVAAARTDGDGGAGSHYTITARVGPAMVRSPYEVTGYDPPAWPAMASPGRSASRRSTGSPGTGRRQSSPSRSGLPRGPFRLASGLLRRQLQRLIASDLDRLKNLVEAEIPCGW